MPTEKNIPNSFAGGDKAKTPFDHVVELVNQYGGAGKVPEDLLEQHGYSRRDDGTLAPIGLEVQKMWTMEEKEKQKPFEAFEVTLKGSLAPRHLDDFAIQRLRVLASEIDNFNSDTITELEFIADEETLARAKKLKEAMMQAGLASAVEQAFRGSLLYKLTDFAPLNEIKRTERQSGNSGTPGSVNPPWRLLDRANMDLSEETISEEAILRLNEMAERDRGIVTDVDEIYKTFESWFDIPINNFDKHEFDYLLENILSDDEASNIFISDEIDNLIASLKNQGIETMGQYIMYVVGKLLDETFPGSRKDSYALDTSKVGTLEDMAKYLFHVEQEQIEIAKKLYKEAKANLKLTPFGDANRQSAETRVKEAKDKIKEVKQKILPLREAFERPYYVSRKANQAYDKLSQSLMGGTNGEIALRFVSDVDEKLDSDPGVISGDCTAGSPLPFLSPNQLYNVKVFRDSSHIGNIYLLQVTDKKTQRPYIWHLDAIQIPLNINWDTAAPVIIESLKQKANLKGVEHITTNGENHHISNYNYIANAFRDNSSELDVLGSLSERIAQTASYVVGEEDTKMQASHSHYYREL